MAMRIPVSFKETEKDLFQFVAKKKSPSAYIKELVEEDKQKKNPTKQQSILEF